MDIEAFRGVREGPIGWRIVVVAITSFVAVVLVMVLAVALAPPRPPEERSPGLLTARTLPSRRD